MGFGNVSECGKWNPAQRTKIRIRTVAFWFDHVTTVYLVDTNSKTRNSTKSRHSRTAKKRVAFPINWTKHPVIKWNHGFVKFSAEQTRHRCVTRNSIYPTKFMIKCMCMLLNKYCCILLKSLMPPAKNPALWYPHWKQMVVAMTTLDAKVYSRMLLVHHRRMYKLVLDAQRSWFLSYVNCDTLYGQTELNSD